MYLVAKTKNLAIHLFYSLLTSSPPAGSYSSSLTLNISPSLWNLLWLTFKNVLHQLCLMSWPRSVPSQHLSQLVIIYFSMVCWWIICLLTVLHESAFSLACWLPVSKLDVSWMRVDTVSFINPVIPAHSSNTCT